jgi:hypothetical protein
MLSSICLTLQFRFQCLGLSSKIDLDPVPGDKRRNLIELLPGIGRQKLSPLEAIWQSLIIYGQSGNGIKTEEDQVHEVILG